MIRSLLTALLVLATAACGPMPEAPAAGEAPLAEAEQSICILPTNLLKNPSLTNVGANGSTTTVTTSVPGAAGWSAALDWSLFTNIPGTIRTRLLPSTRPGDVSNMLHVATTQPEGGLVQVFGAYNSGPQKTISSAWVYVVRGQVGLGTGNGGNTGIDVKSTTTGQWEYLTASNGVSPANEFIIYATSPGGAEFYVDAARVVEAPNLLRNPQFATVGPSGASTSITTVVPGGAGNSAAQSWTLFTNTAGFISSRLLPQQNGTHLMHVVTHGWGNGLVQVFSHPCYQNGPAHTLSGAWVYVRSGKVGIGTGDGGNTGIDAQSTTTNQWEWLQAPNGVSPANEFIIYSTSNTGAEFYVSSAQVHETP
jgi:hypothetical protein